MNIYLVSLATAIGRIRNRPLRWTYIRFSLLICLALACGFVLGGTAPAAPQPQAIPYDLGLAASFAIELVSALVLTGSINLIRRNTFVAILAVLPLTSYQRALAQVIPGMVLCLLIVLVLYIPVRNTLLGFGAPDGLILLSIFAGMLSSFGLVYGLRYQSYRFILSLCVLALQLIGCRLLFLDDFNGLGITLLTLCMICLLLSNVRAADAINQVIYEASKHPRCLPQLPSRLWMLQKILGNKRSTMSLVMTFFYAAGVTTIGALHYAPLTALCSLASVLAAAFIGDIRGISRKYIPPEIACLKGTPYFMRHMVWGHICGLVLFCPILFLAHGLGVSILLLCISQLLLGLSIGGLMSCIIVPEDRDIQSQFITVLLSMCLLIVIPQAPFMQAQTPLVLALYNTLLTLVTLVGSFWFEYKRNTFFWR